jgi:hypothetical protein
MRKPKERHAHQAWRTLHCAAHHVLLEPVPQHGLQDLEGLPKAPEAEHEGVRVHSHDLGRDADARTGPARQQTAAGGSTAPKGRGRGGDGAACTAAPPSRDVHLDGLFDADRVLEDPVVA